MSIPTKQRRKLSRERLAKLRTLENPMLYARFVKNLQPLNPDVDVESLIDPTLEWSEALLDIKSKHPEVVIQERDFRQEYRAYHEDYLEKVALTNDRQREPYTDEEIGLGILEVVNAA